MHKSRPGFQDGFFYIQEWLSGKKLGEDNCDKEEIRIFVP